MNYRDAVSANVNEANEWVKTYPRWIEECDVFALCLGILQIRVELQEAMGYARMVMP